MNKICFTLILFLISMSFCYSFTLTAYDISAYNSNISTMNANLGIDDSYVIDDFEDDIFVDGVNITYRRAIGYHQAHTSTEAWNGSRTLYTAGGDYDNWNNGITFVFSEGVSSFGIGLSNLQQNGWYVEVNGSITLEDDILGMANIIYDGGRNGYLKIDAGQNEVIESVMIERTSAGDRLNFDHLAFKAGRTVPEPGSLLLALLAISCFFVSKIRK